MVDQLSCLGDVDLIDFSCDAGYGSPDSYNYSVNEEKSVKDLTSSEGFIYSDPVT